MPLHASIIIDDTFTRTSDFLTSAADTGQTWSPTDWSTNGSELDIVSNSFTRIGGLTFTPNTLYVLRMDVSVTTANSDWIGFGFSSGTGNAASGSRGFMLHRGTPAVQFFSQGTSGAGSAPSNATGPKHLEINLVTGATLTNSLLTYKLNGDIVGDGITTDATSLSSVFIQSLGSATGSVDNFSLSKINIAQPGLAQLAYLKASNTGEGDEFGFAVSISGDLAVVGAPEEDSAAQGVNQDLENDGVPRSGAAYVYRRNSDCQWELEATLKGSNSRSGFRFGAAVDISGNTIIVGARGENSGPSGDGQFDNDFFSSGAAYIFVYENGAWSEQAYLKASNTGPGDAFAWSVSIDGDTAVVGAFNEDGASSGVNGNEGDGIDDSGAVYVFERNGTTWAQEAYLKSSNPDPFDHFGLSVGISGDLIIVGSGEEDGPSIGVNPSNQGNGLGSSGAAYIFERNTSGNWNQQAYLKASSTNSSDVFGWSVDISNDTAVVGAWGEGSADRSINGNQSDNNSFASGAAYVYTRDNSGTWSQQAYLKSSNGDRLDTFGESVSISGDFIAISADQEDSQESGINPANPSDNNSTESGAAYLFQRISGSWIEKDYLKASNPDSNDGFGSAVAVDGGSVIVGAILEGSSARYDDATPDQFNNDFIGDGAGASYIFESKAIAPINLALSPTQPCPGFGGNPPVSQACIDENNAIGANIGTLSATDPNQPSSTPFLYTLVPGIGDNDNASFIIGGANNDQILTAESFDYEVRAFYSFRVRVTDDTGLSNERSFQLEVRNLLLESIDFSDVASGSFSTELDQAPNADPLNRGIENGLAYALGIPLTGPLTAIHQWRIPVPVIEPNSPVMMEFYILENVPQDVTYKIQILAQGNGIDAVFSEFGTRNSNGSWSGENGGSIVEMPAEDGLIRVRAPFPSTPTERGIMRLQVEISD